MSEPFVTVLADPGWEYDQPLKMSDGVKRSSMSQYTTMSVQQICDLCRPTFAANPRNKIDTIRRVTIAGHPIADTALLGLWITPPLLLEGVHNRVCQAWGFTPKQIVPWIKGRLAIGTVKHGVIDSDGRRNGERVGGDDRDFAELIIQPGMGALTRGCVEYLILATRGKYTKLVKSHSENGLLLAEEDAVIVAPKSTHSRKPDQQYALLERLFPGPRLELFARQAREGWTSWGDEIDVTAPGSIGYRMRNLNPLNSEEDVPLPFSDAPLPEPPVSWG